MGGGQVIRLLLCVFLLVSLPGCLTSKSGKTKRDFPVWASGACYHALNAARATIQSKGTPLKEKSIRVQIIPGQKKFGSLWGWYIAEPSWPGGGMYVGGLTSGDGRLIQIVIDPNRPTDPAALHTGSLIHEMGHHWLIRNGHGSGHSALYDDVIPGWREARRIVGKHAADTGKAADSPAYWIGPDGTHYDIINTEAK